MSGQWDSWPHSEVAAAPSARGTHWVPQDHIGKQGSGMRNYPLGNVPWAFSQIHSVCLWLKNLTAAQSPLWTVVEKRF